MMMDTAEKIGRGLAVLSSMTLTAMQLGTDEGRWYYTGPHGDLCFVVKRGYPCQLTGPGLTGALEEQQRRERIAAFWRVFEREFPPFRAACWILKWLTQLVDRTGQ